MFHPTNLVGPLLDGMFYPSNPVGPPISGMFYPRNLWGRRLTVCFTLGDTSATVARVPGEFPLHARNHRILRAIFLRSHTRFPSPITRVFSTLLRAHYFSSISLALFVPHRTLLPTYSRALFFTYRTRFFHRILRHRSKPGTRRT